MLCPRGGRLVSRETKLLLQLLTLTQECLKGVCVLQGALQPTLNVFTMENIKQISSDRFLEAEKEQEESEPSHQCPRFLLRVSIPQMTDDQRNVI